MVWSLHYEEKETIKTMGELLFGEIKDKGEVVIMNIGTDRSTGDTLGPLIGTMLKEKEVNISIYGTLEDPIHAKNLEDNIELIKVNHPDAYIIAIDACLGSSHNVGKIFIEKKPLKPGAAMGKDLPSVGDLCIKGVVNTSGSMDFMILQNTRLYTTFEMAKTIVEIIETTIDMYNNIDIEHEECSNVIYI